MDGPAESLRDLDDSLARERMLKGGFAVAALLWLAFTQGNTHEYLPIVLFMLLADLMSLNRQRRLVATIKDRDLALRKAMAAAVDDDENPDE